MPAKQQFDENEFAMIAIKHVIEIYIIPEIERRQDEGRLPKPASFTAAQVIFYPDGRKPDIFLDSEVKARFLLKAKTETKLVLGDHYSPNDFESIKAVEPSEELNKDAGYITLIHLGNIWFLSFDLRYNKELSNRIVHTADQFIQSAELSIEEELWASTVDLLFSASELLAKAILLSLPDPVIRKTKTHGTIKSRFNQFTQFDQLSHKYSHLYNKLFNLRDRARYLEGDFTFTREEAMECILILKQMRDDILTRIAPLPSDFDSTNLKPNESQ